MIYPTCIYGFIEDIPDYIITSDILSEYNCYSFYKDLNSGTYYGIDCVLDNTTGQLSVSDKDKQLVHELYKKYVEYKKRIDENFIEPEIGYYLCLDGDIDYYNKTEYNFININDVDD